MNVIWKYRIPALSKTGITPGFYTIHIPTGHRTISVGIDPDGGDLAVWCQVDPSADPFPVTFHVVGTGRDSVQPGERHVGSCIRGGLVIHVYEN